MLRGCRSCLEPRLAQSFLSSRTFVPRQKKLPHRWWLTFSPEEFGRNKYEEYQAREDEKIRSLQEKVEKFRATRGFSQDEVAVSEFSSENGDGPPVHRERKSTWMPPPEKLPDGLGYIVKRSHLGNLPCYVYTRKAPYACLLKVKRVDGDMWKLRKELMEDLDLELIYVNEVTGCLNIHLEYEKKKETVDSVEQFLYQKGF